MAIGKTPVNQLNALPLQDADTAAAGGIIQVVGGNIVHFFDANTLQINGIQLTTFGGQTNALVTPYLDLRGCNHGLLLLRINSSLARIAFPSISLKCQARMGPSDTPSVAYTPGGSLDDFDNAIFQMGSTGHVFGATSAPNEIQTAMFQWQGGDSASNATGTWNPIGSDIRFIIATQVGGIPAGTHLFSAVLWAQS